MYRDRFLWFVMTSVDDFKNFNGAQMLQGLE